MSTWQFDSITVKSEIRDWWVGVFVDPQPDRLKIYICIVPCLPIVLTWTRQPSRFPA